MTLYMVESRHAKGIYLTREWYVNENTRQISRYQKFCIAYAAWISMHAV